MPKKPSWLTLLFLMTAACNPIYYSSPTLNTPQHTESGDFHLGLNGSPIQIQAQGSYALTDHIGIMASHSYLAVGSKKKESLDYGYGDGSMFEGGLGYYRIMEDGANFSIYGLYGFGHFSNTFDKYENFESPRGTLTANLQRFSIQPSLGIYVGFTEWIFSARYGLITYRNAHGDLYYQGENQAAYLNRRSTYLISEPAITLRFGPENIRFQFQGGVNFNMTDQDFLQRRSHLTFGIVFQGLNRK